MNVNKKKAYVGLAILVADAAIGGGCGLFVRKLAKSLTKDATPIRKVAVWTQAICVSWALGAAVDLWGVHCKEIADQIIDFQETIKNDLDEVTEDWSF